ncbi:hypothetical protein B0T18DRAFT_134611 [Schizothecium vesticola]|uniref:DOMON domain-containing protein n=1 Tax=Schizothecium vesticola TaxID=314040 RepID=A0AA40EU83_9PEZI|nr:hypothetical protein B0T18DRAFT_134611 [Schizothecium vesticola]
MLPFNKLLVSKPHGGLHSLLSFFLVLLAHVAAVESATNNTSVSLAVAAFNGVNFQLLRLDASGTLFFSQAVNSTWQTVPDTIALTVKPKPNSPIGIVAWSPSGVAGDTSVRSSPPSAVLDAGSLTLRPSRFVHTTSTPPTR